MTTRSTPWSSGTPCWVDMAVADIRGAKRFYGDVLGWTFVDTGAMLGHYTLCQVDGRNAAALYRPFPGVEPTGWTVYLASEDAAGTLKLTEENDGSVVSEPLDIPGIGTMAVGADPCGGEFGVWQTSGMIGFQVTDEPGAVTRTEALLTDQVAGATFYEAVFGYTYQPVPGGCTTVHLDGHPAPVAAMGPATGASSRWRTSFAVAGLDATVARLEAAGGSVVTAAAETPFGRAGEYADPAGMHFVLREQ